MSTKCRSLSLLSFLYEHSSEEHPVSNSDILAFYQDQGFSINRNTIHDDLASLEQAGYEVISNRKETNLYYLSGRPFEHIEIRMLADAISSAQFIDSEKSDKLVRKLSLLADVPLHSVHTAVHKTENRQMYYCLNEIENAIHSRKKIQFQYVEYLPDKTKSFRHKGAFYHVSPYELIWKEDRYYLTAWNDARNAVNTFRLDLIENVQLLNEEAHEIPAEYSHNHYALELTRMYDGETSDITLLCENRMMTKLIDKFGMNFDSEIVDDRHFIAKVRTTVTCTFFGWLFQYAGQIQLIGPESAICKYREQLQSILYSETSCPQYSQYPQYSGIKP